MNPRNKKTGRKSLFFLFLFLSIFFFEEKAKAYLLNTSYLSLELPAAWTCVQIKSDWTCRPQGLDSHTMNLLVLAKVASPEDTLTSLSRQLKEKRTVTGRGFPVTSVLQWIHEISLSDYPWVEALHWDREVEGFSSYYLATVTEHLSLLLVFNQQRNQQKKENFNSSVIEQIKRTLVLKDFKPAVSFSQARKVQPSVQPLQPSQPRVLPPSTKLSLLSVSHFFGVTPLLVGGVVLGLFILVILVVTLLKKK